MQARPAIDAPSPEPVQAPRDRTVDLTGVSVSDLVRLYFEKVEPGRQFVACPEVVADTRLVSIRSLDVKTAAAIEQLLSRVGYQVTSRAGVSYVCPAVSSEMERAELPVTPGVVGVDGEAGPLNPPGGSAVPSGGLPGGKGAKAEGPVLVSPIPNAYATYPLRSGGYRAMEQGKDPANYVDRLVGAGWMFAGCTDGPDGIKVLLRAADASLMVPIGIVRKSNVSYLLQCRVGRGERATRAARRESPTAGTADDLMYTSRTDA